MRIAWFAVLAAAAGCGGGVRYRPLEVEILSLSARAEVLAIEVFPSTAGQTCAGIMNAAAAAMARSSIRVEWTRSSGAPRTFELPEVDDSRVTIVAHASDAAGKPIQYACAEVKYEEIGDLESGVLTVQLSARER